AFAWSTMPPRLLTRTSISLAFGADRREARKSVDVIPSSQNEEPITSWTAISSFTALASGPAAPEGARSSTCQGLGACWLVMCLQAHTRLARGYAVTW